jgi:(p)ppGpp synthase/HD superfamily hydrolase
MGKDSLSVSILNHVTGGKRRMIKNSIMQAYRFAEKAHKGQKRKYTDLPYFTHPKGVARIIEDMNGTEDMICAALLHDVVEDCGVTLEQIIVKFNPHVTNLVAELTSNKKEMKKFSSKGAYLADKMLKMSDEALTIKLADRLHNISFLNHDKIPSSFINKYCGETFAIIGAVGEMRKGKTLTQKVLAGLIIGHCTYVAHKIGAINE